MIPANINACAHDIRTALDFSVQPQGKAFWDDVVARLDSHFLSTQKDGYATHHHDYTRPPTTRELVVKVEYNRPLLLIAYNLMSMGTLDNFLDANLWRWLYSTFEPYRTSTWRWQPRIGRDYHIEADPVSWFDEHLLCNEFSWIRPFFADLPWYVANHYPHHDPKDMTLLRYFPRSKPFHTDFAITCKPGKYLKQFYGHILTDEQVEKLAVQFRANGLLPELHIAKSADDIAHIYDEGPNSCMAAGKATFEGNYPPRSYAGGDLGVAYLKRNGRINSRALVNFEKKIYSRLYGDATPLERALRANGYQPTHGSSPEAQQNKLAFNGSVMRPLILSGYAPLEYKYADEPVLILPYGDHGQFGSFDKETGLLRWGADRRTGPHKFSGGASLKAFPLDPKRLRLRGDSERYVRYICDDLECSWSIDFAEDFGRPRDFYEQQVRAWEEKNTVRQPVTYTSTPQYG